METTARSTEPTRTGGPLAAARALAADVRGAATSVQMVVLVVSLSLGAIVGVRNLGGAVSERSRCAGDQIVALDGTAPCNDDGSGGPGQDAPAQPTANEGDGGDGGQNEESDEERDVGKELLDLVLEITGVNDAVKCFTEGDIAACVFTVLNFTPGKIFGVGFKLLKNIPKINRLIDRLLAARKAREAEKCAAGKCDKPNTCFAPGTPIATVGGTTPIEALRIGDEVWSRDEETGEEGYRPVVNTFVTPDQALLAISLRDPDGRVETLEVTAPHPFQVEGLGWVQAGKLEVGDRVASAGGASLEVIAADPTGRTTTVYNVEVEEFHTYFVGEAGAWVHNDCKDKDKDKEAPKKNKKTGEKCKGDGDCATGHCHSKRNGDQVCVDCSKKEIGDFLGIKDRFCKKEPISCDKLTLDDDISAFESRISNGDRCIGARNAENQRCFRGGDPGHNTAVKQVEKARTNCKKKLDDKLERDTAPDPGAGT